MMEEQTFLLEIQSRSLLELKKYGGEELDVTLCNINIVIRGRCILKTLVPRKDSKS